jgi:hypothetical protein
MKPVAHRADRRSKGGFSPGPSFPLVDFNYQSFSIDRFNGGADREPTNSFFDISRDYFQREARRNFLGEVGFFLVLAGVLAGAVVQGALIIIHFLQLPPG